MLRWCSTLDEIAKICAIIFGDVFDAKNSRDKVLANSPLSSILIDH